MRGILRAIPIPCALVLLAAPSASAQSVADIVDQMYEAFERHSRGVDNYTLVQSMMGFETVTYFEKEIVDGRPIFRMSGSSTEGFSMSLGDDDVGYGGVFQFGPDLVEHGRYGGREQIDGNAVHVLAIDDLSTLDIGGPSGPEDMDFVAKNGRIYVDVETMIVRRMEFDGEATSDRGVHEMTSRVDMEDFREVDGLLIPHRTVMHIEGLGGMMDPEMQAQMEEMRKQLESMPEAQRAMMERMMAGQMENLEKMMNGEGMTIEVTVTEVRVNAGPPSG